MKVQRPERRITTAGRQLLAHIRRMKMSIPTWCEDRDLCRITVQKVINGEQWSRISVNTALAIIKAVEADGGALNVSAFSSETAKAS